MSERRFDRILMGTALALVLALPGQAALAQQSGADAAIEAQVPLPALTDDLPPPSLKDVTTAQAASDAEIEARVPMPLLADDVPPPSKADAGMPAQTAAAPATPAPAPVQATAPAEPAPAPAAAAASPPAATPAPAATAAAPAAAPAPAAPAAVAAPATPAPAATVAGLDPADRAIGDKLREVIGGKTFDRIITNRKERAAIEGFYQARDFAPLWIEKGVASARAKAAIARMKMADALGLQPSEYKTPELAAATPDAAAEAELRFANVVLTYARHIQSGRTDPARISNNIEYKLPMPDPSDVLAKLAESKDVAQTFDSFEPPHAGYRALKHALLELRGGKDDETVARIGNGPTLKLGKKAVDDPRVPALRKRLHVAGDADDTTYDAKLAEAVKKFQQGAGLSATGTLTPSTVDALDGPRRDRQIDQVVASMERWRWLPRDLGKMYVMLNIPDFSLRVVRDNAVVWRTRVVVGKPSTPTPTFSGVMENILVNPTWHVPDSITYGEYMPAMQNDPSVLARMGLKMEQEKDGRIHVWQPPGPGNALGRIKFNFPNKFSVYMHDTPDKNLFSHDRRSYSHGCMRVQNPDQFGAVLADYALPGQGFTAAKLTGMFGQGEAWLKFTNKIQVHITYMTAYVDDAGKLVTREDIYGLDSRVAAALKGDDRDYGQEEVSAQIKRTPIPDRRFVVRNEERSPVENFFGRLFR